MEVDQVSFRLYLYMTTVSKYT